MTELERVKQETYDHLFLTLKYSHETAKKVAESIDRITGYYKGKPSRVITKDGVELYL